MLLFKEDVKGVRMRPRADLCCCWARVVGLGVRGYSGEKVLREACCGEEGR